MRRILSFKMFESTHSVPDELAIWAAKHYWTTEMPDSIPTVPRWLLESSKKYIKSNSDGHIYRGVRLAGNDSVYISSVGESWTLDPEIAENFAWPGYGGGQAKILSIDVEELGDALSMDVLFDSFDKDLIARLGDVSIWGSTFSDVVSMYESEREVVILEEVRVPIS
jgi:hypothetical protein